MSAWKLRFFTIWTGQHLSVLGSRASQFAVVWWLTRETGSATVLAVAGVLALAPDVLLKPVAGVCVDRWSRRRVMILADSANALVSAGMAWLFWMGSWRSGTYMWPPSCAPWRPPFTSQPWRLPPR